MRVFYAKGEQNTNFMSEKPLFVNNCGFYREINSDIVVNRPRGRDDYHLILCSSGKICVGNEELDPGKAYLFCPSSPQHYRYESGVESEYYWLHFSGKIVSELFEEYGLNEGVVDVVQSRGEVERLIKMMLHALSEKYKNADAFCEGLLAALLVLISSPPAVSSPYSKAIKLLSDPSCADSVEEIASLYNVSPNHFIRSFKQYAGVSPNAFRIKKRMEIASELLVSTDMNVSEIAAASGYDDPLYFSRVFKKHVGASPSEYRRGRIDEMI